MSDYLPFEIQMQILKKLPIKPLIQFRSVSKTWKSMIDSSHFIATYNSHMQRLLVAYEGPDFCSSIVDDHTFPHQKVYLTNPLLLNMFNSCTIIGSSHGLFCLYGFYQKRSTIYESHFAILWNPSIRKEVPVVVPKTSSKYAIVLGFGVCLKTTDPKIVKIARKRTGSRIETIYCIPPHVEVFTLSTGAWRSPCSTNLPRTSIKFPGLHVVVGDFLYWLATDKIPLDSGIIRSSRLVMSFDITSEEFREVNLPDNLAHHPKDKLSIFKLRESLVVLENVVEVITDVFGVWMMDDLVSQSFTKLFSISVSTPYDALVAAFRKNGEPIVQIFEDASKLLAYEQMDNILGNDRIVCSCYYVYPYMETLLLLDQPDLTVYNETETIKFLDRLVLYDFIRQCPNFELLKRK